MRDFKGMKRQRGRNRSGGGGNTGGKPQPHNANRAFDSNGPEGVKVRGNPQHVFEKYQQLARDANAAGDRVLGENYLQHAEHYFRLLRALQPSRPASEIIGRDQFTSGYDIDFEDESGQQQLAEADQASEAAGNGESQSDEGESRANRDRGGWQGQNNQGQGAQNRDGQNRDSQNRDGQNRDGQNRDFQNRDGQNRDTQNRDGQNRDGQGRRDRDRDRWRDRRDDRPRTEEAGGERRPDRDRPERNDRPDRDERPAERVEAPAEPRGPMLRDSEGGASHAPAFLQARTEPRAPAAEDGAEPAPRRRRAPRKTEAPSDQD